MDIAKKVATAYLQKKADAAATEDEKLIPAGRLVDLAVLVMAYKAHLDYLEGAEIAHSPNTAKGQAMIKRYSDEISTGMQQIFGPLAERQDSASIKTPLKKALSATSPTQIGIVYWANAFQEVMPWLKTRSTVFNGLFTGKVARAAKELAAVAQEESPAARLNKLAGITPVSGMTATRKWVETLAAEAGAPLSDTESVLVDAQVAKSIGQDLNQVDASLQAVSPNSPDAAGLQTKKVELLGQLDQVAKTSTNPAAVIAAASQSKPTGNFATQMGAKLGMTPDQEDAMMTRGRVIIAAGAGSGKCIVGGTLVQTDAGFTPIENLCGGLDAEQDVAFEASVHGI